MPGDDLSPQEIVFRRVAEASVKNNGWIRPDGRVDPQAFWPNKGDKNGLSLTRAVDAASAAYTAPKGKRYYFVPIRVGDVRGLRIVGDAPDHAIVVGWTYEMRSSDEVRGGAEHLAAISGFAEGPFDGLKEMPTAPPPSSGG